jgi:hypothetical protein
MVVHHEVVPVPTVLWFTAAVVTVSAIILRWFVYRRVIGCSTREAFGAFLAAKALSHTIAMASLRASLGRHMTWRRTDKFGVQSSLTRALRSAGTELVLAAVTLITTAVGVVAMPRSGLVIFLAIGGVLQSGRYLASPLVALIAEHHIRAGKQMSGQLDHTWRIPLEAHTAARNASTLRSWPRTPPCGARRDGV